MARLEQPVEKIPVYFQKQIKAFRLCSANLSLKAAGKICSLPLSLTPRPLQVMTFRPASPPLSSPLPVQTDPSITHLLLVCTVRAFRPRRTGDNGIEVDKKKIRASLVAQWLRIHLPMQGHGFEPWSEIPHAAEQLSPCATTTEPAL